MDSRGINTLPMILLISISLLVLSFVTTSVYSNTTEEMDVKMSVPETEAVIPVSFKFVEDSTEWGYVTDVRKQTVEVMGIDWVLEFIDENAKNEIKLYAYWENDGKYKYKQGIKYPVWTSVRGFTFHDITEGNMYVGDMTPDFSMSWWEKALSYTLPPYAVYQGYKQIDDWLSEDKQKLYIFIKDIKTTETVDSEQGVMLWKNGEFIDTAEKRLGTISVIVSFAEAPIEGQMLSYGLRDLVKGLITFDLPEVPSFLSVIVSAVFYITGIFVLWKLFTELIPG